MTLHGAASDRESLHDVTLHGGGGGSVVLLRLIEAPTLAGEVIHQPPRLTPRRRADLRMCPRPHPLIARPEHCPGHRHHAHVGHAARVIGRLQAPAAQQLLEAVICREAGHLLQPGHCQATGHCRLTT